MPSNKDIGIVAVDDVHWEPLKPTIDCFELQVLNTLGATLLYRTLDTDPNSELSIFSLQGLVIYQSNRNTKLNASSSVGFLRLSTGAGNVKRISAY